MARTLLVAGVLLLLALSFPVASAACYDSCIGSLGCKTCVTGQTVTYQVCVQTSPCKCHTYFVPAYQCDGLAAQPGAPGERPTPEVSAELFLQSIGSSIP